IDEALRVLTPIRADDDPRMVEAKAVKVGILAALHQDEAARALRSAIASVPSTPAIVAVTASVQAAALH
ncbi:MAG TPA: hypothetical protein VHE32_09780, partial [Rhodanobacteraceae bacterium]|nr:hypothetical protein [Rhodanobacteraceae bacterium]